jgi:hypothetical protein
MKYLRSNFDIRNEIKKRVDREAEIEWARKKSSWSPMPDETKYVEKEPPLLAVYNFARSLRP